MRGTEQKDEDDDVMRGLTERGSEDSSVTTIIMTLSLRSIRHCAIVSKKAKLGHWRASHSQVSSLLPHGHLTEENYGRKIVTAVRALAIAGKGRGGGEEGETNVSPYGVVP